MQWKLWKRKPIGQNVVPTNAWRGNEWFTPGGVKPDHNYISMVQDIPMDWIMQWFSRQTWFQWDKRFMRDKVYRPPALGPTFALIYHRDAKTGKTTCGMGTKKEEDPYLESVCDETERMHLYDDGYWQQPNAYSQPVYNQGERMHQYERNWQDEYRRQQEDAYMTAMNAQLQKMSLDGTRR